MENVVSIGSLVVPVLVAIVSFLASKASGGPRATRRSKRLLDQATALEAQSANPSYIVQGASALHRDALLRELAKAQYPYSLMSLMLFMGGAYMAIGIWQLITNDSGGFLVLGVVVAIVGGTAAFMLTSYERRRVFHTGSIPSPLLSRAGTKIHEYAREKFFRNAKIYRIRGRSFRNALARLPFPGRKSARDG